MIKRPLILAAMVGALGLSGCISLFPKANPATLYRISAAFPAAATAPAGPRAVVLRAPTAFTRIAASDEILTTTGSQSAYIANSRWAAPAPIMFDEALAAAFTAVAPNIRLATRGDVAAADRVLRIEVRSFEAQYRSGQDAAPTVLIEARATLSHLRDRSLASERIFRVESLASDNRVGAIVEAFDGATAQVVGDIARWTQDQPVTPTPAA